MRKSPIHSRPDALTNLEKPQANSLTLNLFLFLCGALTTFDIRIVGRVTIAEILVFISLPILFLTRKVIFWNSNFLRCSLLLAAMFIFTIIGDLYNGFYLELSARAFARPVFIFGFMLFFIFIFERAPKSLVWFAYGLVIAGVINYFRPSEFEKEGSDNASTYAGVVFRVEPLIFALAATSCTWLWLKSRIGAVLAIIGCIVILGILGSSRSSLLIYIFTVFTLSALIILNPNGKKHFSLNRNRLVGLGIAGFAAVCASYMAYITLAPAGALGEDQRLKFEDQSKTTLGTSPLGFVLAGRPQVYAAILGIMDRPIMGFGSWRHDLTAPYVIDAFVDVGTDPKVIDHISRTGNVSGAGHSVLFQAWVENGIISAICWLGIGLICCRVFITNLRMNTILTAFLVLNFMNFGWNFLFSPPPVHFRYTVGIFLAFYVVFMDRRKPLRHFLSLT